MTALLAARGLTYCWQGRTLVEGVSMDVAPGRVTVVVGPNGAGKSTLLRMLSGELRPSGGDVLLGGEPLSRLAPWRLACRRAVMTQSVEVSLPFTVAEVVALGAAVSRGAGAAIVARALAAAGVERFANALYHRLSGGEQRRVQFARALAQLDAGAALGGAQALLLDEPVAHLDLRHQLALLDEARRRAVAGVAVVAVLHELNLAARCADDLALMRGGRLVAFGPPATVLSETQFMQTFGLDLSVATTARSAYPIVLPARWLNP